MQGRNSAIVVGTVASTIYFSSSSKKVQAALECRAALDEHEQGLRKQIQSTSTKSDIECDCDV